MQRKVLLIYGDGTLIKAAPAGYTDVQPAITPRDGTLDKAAPAKVDSFDHLRFLPGVIRNLYFIRKNLDFELVMIINKDYSETTAFQQENFDRLQTKILELFAGEGIIFDNILINNSLESYISNYDLTNSYVISNRHTDMQLAENLGCKGILLTAANADSCHLPSPFLPLISWDQIKEFLFAGERQATIQRTTKETDVFISLNLDGNGDCNISTGIGFFDHMLEQISKHGGLDLTIKVKGDLHVDEHHTVEDTAIALGEAICQALSNKRGIERYGYCLPMDDCLCTLALDFGGRSWFVWDAQFKREMVGDMPTELFSHFFKSLSDAAKMNLHIKSEGENEHHKAESIFKAFAKAIKMAVKRDVYKYNLPTTKGLL